MWKNFENNEMFAKDFIQHVYYASMFCFSLKDDWKVLKRYLCPK